jgi:hypothetical protein
MFRSERLESLWIALWFLKLDKNLKTGLKADLSTSNWKKPFEKMLVFVWQLSWNSDNEISHSTFCRKNSFGII